MNAHTQRRPGATRIDYANACVWRGSRAIALPPKAFSVLRYLAEHPGRLVTKQELLEAVWPGTCVTDAVLKVSIRKIRKALGDQAAAPRFIETLHRRGYRLIADLSGTGDMVCLPALPHPYHDPSPFIGRNEVVAWLRARFDQTLAGQRSVVFVGGEAGIGKTAVVDALLKEIAWPAGLLMGRGQCIEKYSAGEAYSPILEALSQICRQTGAPVVSLLARYAPSWLAQLPWLMDMVETHDPRAGMLNPTRERMLREITEFLEALTTRMPVVLVLEDLHWGDYSTLDLVAVLASRRVAARLMLLITYRPEEALVADHPLCAVKQDLLLHGSCAELTLNYLTERDVDAYLAVRFEGHQFPPALAQFIYRRAEGNPLFMVNVVDYLLARESIGLDGGAYRLRAQIQELVPDVPECLRQIIERQIERCSAEEQKLLEAASIAGPEFACAAVSAALRRDAGKTEEQLMRLVLRARILSPREPDEWPDGVVSERYAFVHVLYQNVLYKRQTEAQRVQFHRRIGERLEGAYPGRTEERAAELALHFERGRAYPKALEHLRQAAATETARYAHREAAGYLTRALALTERLPAEERLATRMALLGQRGHVRRAMADMEGAADDFEALAIDARGQSLTEHEAMALAARAMALAWVDRRECLVVVRELRAIATRLDDPRLRAQVQGWSAYWRVLWRGWRDSDVRACATAVRAARRAADRRQLNLLLGRYSYLQCLRSRYHTADRTAEKAARLASQTGNAFEYLLAHFYRAWALLHAGEWGEMRAVLRDGTQTAERSGQHLWCTMFRLERAWFLLEIFDFPAGGALAERGLQEASHNQVAYGEVLGSVLLGRAHLALTEHEAAFNQLQGSRRRLVREPVLMDWILRMPLSLCLSDYWREKRDYRRARRHAGRLYALAARPGERTYQALARRALSQIALAEGRWLEADKEIRRALKLVERASPVAQWRVYATAAEHHERAGRDGEASRYWNASASVFTRLADSLTDAGELRNRLLKAPPVQEIMRRSAQPRSIDRPRDS